MSIKDYFIERKFKKQRAKNKYSDDMCWGLYYTLLEILPQMVNKLREYENGYPDGLEFEEIDKISKPWIHSAIEELKTEYMLEGKDIPDLSVKDKFTRWQLILKRIQWCLEQADEEKTDIANEYSEEYSNQLWKDCKTFDDIFIPKTYDDKGKVLTYEMKNSNSIDDELRKKYVKREVEIQDYRDKCKTEGFNLINKYFWNLWD